MQRYRARLVPGVLACLLAATILGGCGSLSEKLVEPVSQIPGIGPPADAPARPAEEAAYPAVHDMPTPRSNSTLTGLEQKRMEDDLTAARDEQQKTAGTAPKKGAKGKTDAKGKKDTAKDAVGSARTEPAYVPPRPGGEGSSSRIY